MSAVLAASALNVGYGRATAVTNVDLEVREGHIAALIGPNGAGKTTLLLALAGVLPPRSGDVRWLSRPTQAPLHVRARAGLRFVSEERAVFSSLSAEDNLTVGRVTREDVLELFPELESHLKVRVGLLSGGQQQMLGIGIALARRPRVLLVDELSLGLAPQIVERLIEVLRGAASRGCGVLIVEQQIERALRASDYAYVMQRGEIVLEGDASDLYDRRKDIEEAYFSSKRKEG